MILNLRIENIEIGIDWSPNHSQVFGNTDKFLIFL